jgi:hypothetical protein
MNMSNLSKDDKSSFTPLGTRINDNIRCHGNDAFVQEKADRAQKMIEKAGFPKLPENNENKTRNGSK